MYNYIVYVHRSRRIVIEVTYRYTYSHTYRLMNTYNTEDLHLGDHILTEDAYLQQQLIDTYFYIQSSHSSIRLVTVEVYLLYLQQTYTYSKHILTVDIYLQQKCTYSTHILTVDVYLQQTYTYGICILTVDIYLQYTYVFTVNIYLQRVYICDLWHIQEVLLVHSNLYPSRQRTSLYARI